MVTQFESERSRQRGYGSTIARLERNGELVLDQRAKVTLLHALSNLQETESGLKGILHESTFHASLNGQEYDLPFMARLVRTLTLNQFDLQTAVSTVTNAMHSEDPNIKMRTRAKLAGGMPR